MVDASLQQALRLARAGGDNLAAAQKWGVLIGQARTSSESSLHEASLALNSLQERTRRLHSDIAEVLASTRQTFTRNHREHQDQFREHQAVQATVEPSLRGMLEAARGARAELAEQRALASQSLARAEQAALAATAVEASSREFRDRLATFRQSLGQARQQVEDRSVLALAQFERMEASLQQQLRALEQECEQARANTLQRWQQLLAGLAELAQGADATVEARFAVRLGQEMTVVARDLGQAVQELRAVAVAPHKTADTLILSMMQKVRESLDFLQRLEKVFRVAKADLF